MATRGYSAIGLVGIKNPHNYGSVLRAADCFDASMIAIEGIRFKRSCQDTTKAWRHIPVVQGEDLFSMVPFSCVPVAIEFVDGAVSLEDFSHPQSAFYIFGPEDGSVPSRIVERCKHVIQIPTRRCLNLAATVNVVLYDRMVKRGAKLSRLAA